MALYNWWHGRNYNWAAKHLTPKKYQKIQKNWKLAARLGPAAYIVLIGAGFTLMYAVFFAAMGYVTSLIPRLEHAQDREFLRITLRTQAIFAPFLGLFFAAFRYITLREASTWPQPSDDAAA